MTGHARSRMLRDRLLEPAWIHAALVLAGIEPPPPMPAPVARLLVAEEAPQWHLVHWDIRQRAWAPLTTEEDLHESAALLFIDRALDVMSHRPSVSEAIQGHGRRPLLVCARSATMVGAGELQPLAALIRRVNGGESESLRDPALGVLRELRDRGAQYITGRPFVAEWVDRVLADPGSIDPLILRSDFVPLSHAARSTLLQSLGLDHVDHLDPMHVLDLEAPSAAFPLIDGAPSAVARESLRELATRPPERLDLFAQGCHAMSGARHRAAVASLRLEGLVNARKAPEADVSEPAWQALCAGDVQAGDLGLPDDDLIDGVRVLVAARQARATFGATSPGAGPT